MRKIVLFFLSVVAAAGLVGCGVDPMEGVSERRSGFYSVSDGEYTLTAVSGVREEPFVSDGSVGALKPYTLLTLVPVKFDVDAVYTYTAEFGGSVYGGAMTVHPFAASFSSEFDAEAMGNLKVTVTRGDETREYALESLVTGDMMSYDRAVEAAGKALSPPSGGEIRVRLIKNPIEGEGLCWHVSFIFSDSSCAALVDPVTAKIIAKKGIEGQ